MTSPSVVVLGGGLSGVAAAYTLARAGWRDIVIVEREPSLGGLAGGFERNGYFYPLGYHHILHRDRHLLFFLREMEALSSIRWRKINLYFRTGGELHNLSTPAGFLRFPMGVADKLRFVRMMLRAVAKADWSDWIGRSAADLVDAWGGPGVRRALFEPLTQLKFELPCEDVSGAWLGARLRHREGSAPLGYIPGTNWTRTLCEGVTRLVKELGVRVRTGATIQRITTDRSRITEIELECGERIGGDVFVSSIPTAIYCRLVPDDDTPHLRSIRYTALLSAMCTTNQEVAPDFYWMSLAPHDLEAGGLFMLNSLNPTIGAPGEACLNFVNHIQSRDRRSFQRSDDEVWDGYRRDYRELFGCELESSWSNLVRIPMYSPVFHRDYQNPPVKSATMRNVYFAGNYRTFPSVASTGTALGSGVDTGASILGDHGATTDAPAAIAAFRLPSMPRG